MAMKTILGHVIIWCDKEKPFNPNNITNIRDNELKYWAEVEEITPPVKEFSDGEATEKCKWWDAKVITDLEDKQIEAPHLCCGRMALTRALNDTPEYVSYRWKQ